MDEKSEDKEESSKNPNKNRKTKVPNFARPGNAGFLGAVQRAFASFT